MPGKVKKPRTYRKNTRHDFLNIALNLDALLRFLRALIRQCQMWQAFMTAKCRAGALVAARRRRGFLPRR